MAKLGMDEGQPIEHSMITKAIENAQRKVEAHNFEIRKHLLEYDDVMNKQREVIYTQRRDVLESEDIHALVEEMSTEVLEELFTTHVPPDSYVDAWNLTGLTESILHQYGVHVPLTPESTADFSRDALFEHVCTCLKAHYVAKMQESIGEEQYRGLERWVVLQVIDKQWKDHLLAMDYLKEGIGLRGYGQKNPLNEYKREAFEMFVGMTERIKAEAVEYLFKIELTGMNGQLTVRQRRRDQPMMEHHGALSEGEDSGSAAVKTVRRQGAKVGRNAPCPCGSGKKYKKCCGV